MFPHVTTHMLHCELFAVCRHDCSLCAGRHAHKEEAPQGLEDVLGREQQLQKWRQYFAHANRDRLGRLDSFGRNLDSLGGGHVVGRSVNTIGSKNMNRGLDSLGGGNLVRGLDSIGGGNLVRGLDSIGGGNIVRDLDSIGGGNLVKSLDPIGGGNLV